MAIHLRQLLRAKKSIPNILSKIEKAFLKQDAQEEIELLSDLVHTFRPKNRSKIEHISIQDLITYLKENPDIRLFFSEYLLNLLKDKRFQPILTESGILKTTGLRREFFNRLIAKIIPHQPEKNTLEYILNQIFYSENDIYWLRKIPKREIGELYDLLGFTSIYEEMTVQSPLMEILNGMALLSQRMSGMALDSEVLKMLPEYADFESPFEQLEKTLDKLDSVLRKSNCNTINPYQVEFQDLMEAHKHCEAYVKKAFENAKTFGISMNANQSLLKIKQQLERFVLMADFLCVENSVQKKEKSLQLAVKLISLNCMKNNLKKLVGDSTQLVAYEITQHSAKTGEHYITQDKKEYFNMLLTAGGGGLIVGFLCIFKLLLGKVHVSDFGHAFFYSMNYSSGFIAIYLMGFTLATKQPAMTAATLIKTIENGMQSNLPKKTRHKEFAQLFARLFRSQFIAFVGNVIVAFPVSLLIISLIQLVFSVNIAEAKADVLLEDISPIHSLAIFHAAIAGVFLFLSGIISGSISNRNKYSNMYYRIQEHPWLKLTFGKEKSKKIASWFEKKWPGVASNFWFGVFMGSVASIGAFFGLNLDIRHITFAAGNMAIGLFGNDFQVSMSMLFWVVFGIGIIGFVNFIVSFLLSLGLAFRSRNIPTKELRYLFSSVWIHFKRNKLSFFYPTKKV
jgi:site-specific recombinase